MTKDEYQKKASEIYCASFIEAVGKLGYEAIEPFFHAVADIEEETMTFSITVPLRSELISLIDELIRDPASALSDEYNMEEAKEKEI